MGVVEAALVGLLNDFLFVFFFHAILDFSILLFLAVFRGSFWKYIEMESR